MEDLFCSVHVWTLFRKGGGLPYSKLFVPDSKYFEKLFCFRKTMTNGDDDEDDDDDYKDDEEDDRRKRIYLLYNRIHCGFL